MHNMLRVIFLLALATAFCTASACDKVKTMSAAGKYVSEKSPDHFRELKADGTFYEEDKNAWGGQTTGMTGTYQIEGNQITLKLEMGMAMRSTLSGNTMVDSDGERLVKK